MSFITINQIPQSNFWLDIAPYIIGILGLLSPILTARFFKNLELDKHKQQTFLVKRHEIYFSTFESVVNFRKKLDRLVKKIKSLLYEIESLIRISNQEKALSANGISDDQVEEAIGFQDSVQKLKEKIQEQHENYKQAHLELNEAYRYLQKNEILSIYFSHSVENVLEKFIIFTANLLSFIEKNFDKIIDISDIKSSNKEEIQKYFLDIESKLNDYSRLTKCLNCKIKEDLGEKIDTNCTKFYETIKIEED